MKPFNSFFFRCFICGDYRVSEETFRAFITPQLNDILNKKLEDEIVERAIVDFSNFGQDCPRCSGLREFSVNLVIIKKGD
jgi:hypothetical protein